MEYVCCYPIGANTNIAHYTLPLSSVPEPLPFYEPVDRTAFGNNTFYGTFIADGWISAIHRKIYRPTCRNPHWLDELIDRANKQNPFCGDR